MVDNPKLDAGVSRCPGWWYAVQPGRSAVHAVCMDCARRTAKPEERQRYIVPPEPIEGCAYKLTEEKP
jgi:hypothetical protein